MYLNLNICRINNYFQGIFGYGTTNYLHNTVQPTFLLDFNHLTIPFSSRTCAVNFYSSTPFPLIHQSIHLWTTDPNSIHIQVHLICNRSDLSLMSAHHHTVFKDSSFHSQFAKCLLQQTLWSLFFPSTVPDIILIWYWSHPVFFWLFIVSWFMCFPYWFGSVCLFLSR